MRQRSFYVPHQHCTARLPKRTETSLYFLLSVSIISMVSSPRSRHPRRIFKRRRSQIAPHVTRIHPRGKGRFAARERYFLHARTCRNKGRSRKGRVGHEGTPDSRGVAPRKWIQLNSHTRRARLSRAERNVRSRATRRRRRDGRDAGMEPRQTESKCVYPRDVLQTEFNEPEIFCGVSLRKRFPLASQGNGCAIVGWRRDDATEEKGGGIPTGNVFTPGTR